MKAVVLAYHSHHVLSASYAENDHLALPVDLATVTAAGWRIVPLERIVDALVAARDGDSRGAAASAEPLLALTFDDGPVFDLDDFVHPVLGFQRGFVGAMRDFGATAAGRRQPELSATSFVIASPEARKVAESTFDRQYTYLVPGALDDAWWTRAIESRPAGDRQPQLGPPAPGAAPGRALGGCAGRLHARRERGRRRRADPRRDTLPPGAHRRQGGAVLRLSVRALERLPRRRLPAAAARRRRRAGGIHDRAASRPRRRQRLPPAALRLRPALEAPGRAGGDPDGRRRRLMGDAAMAANVSDQRSIDRAFALHRSGQYAKQRRSTARSSLSCRKSLAC